MKLLESRRRRIAAASAAGVLAAAAILLAITKNTPQPHVQIVLASDGALMVAGVPGRSLRAQIQNHSVWDGSSPTSQLLVDFLESARYIEQRKGTYDGRAGVIVDDHASFQIARMLVASARISYPEVFLVNGQVADLPRRGPGADPARSLESYVKDCSLHPPPPGCAKK